MTACAVDTVEQLCGLLARLRDFFDELNERHIHLGH